METGERLIKFKVAKGDIEITALTFDPSLRRLLTGARDGTVSIWNFNNGACLRRIQSANDNEVNKRKSCINQIYFSSFK